MSRRRVANPLALAALACLAERPMHPYEIASTLRQRHKDAAIKLNYGSLYSVIEALCRNQFIEATETERQGNRPERTVYSLTAAGQHELTDWLSELISRPVREYTQFGAGISLLPVLPPALAAALLNERADHLDVVIAQAQSIETLLSAKKVPRLFILDHEYRKELLLKEREWVRALADEISRGALDGHAEWQGWYDDDAPAKART